MTAYSVQLKRGPKPRMKENAAKPNTLTNIQRATIIADAAAKKPDDLWFVVYKCALKQLECKDAGNRLKGGK